MMRTIRHRLLFAAGLVAGTVGAAFAQTASSDEDVARRQLESGRAFVRQGNFTEALRDFKAVAETHGTSSFADNALLEIARYYLDTVGDTKEATAAVDAILKSYPTSDSAPDAYVMAGRLALARGHAPADLEAALANFERVARLFPASPAVPRSLVLAAEAHWYAGRYDVALSNLARVALESPRDPSAADAHLAAGRVFLSLGDPISAMEELQQVRNGWPDTPAAATALSHLSILHRLYLKAGRGPAFALASDPVGPAKLKDVKSLAMNGRGDVYWASDAAAGVVTPAGATAPGAAKPRGLTRDASGNVVVVEAAALRPIGGTPIPLVVTRGTGAQEPLKSADSAVQLSNGDWLVYDENERGIQRFSRAGAYVGPFSPAKLVKLALSQGDDKIAGLDRDQKAVVFYDADGKVTGRVPLKGTGYDLSNPVDLAFDAFGHLYVLDRGEIAVFSPYDATPVPIGTTPAAATSASSGSASRPPVAAARPVGYRLLTTFTEPPNNPTGFRRATAFVLDRSGTIFLFDERAERVLVYR